MKSTLELCFLTHLIKDDVEVEKKKSNIKFRGKKISFFLHCYRSAHKMENLFMLQLIAMALVLRASTSTAYPNSIGDYSGSSMFFALYVF